MNDIDLLSLLEQHNQYNNLIIKYKPTAKDSSKTDFNNKIISLAHEQILKIEHEINLHHHASFNQDSLYDKIKEKNDIYPLLKPYLKVDSCLIRELFFHSYFREIEYFFEQQPYNQEKFLDSITKIFYLFSTDSCIELFEQLNEGHANFLCKHISSDRLNISVLFSLFAYLLDKCYTDAVDCYDILNFLFDIFINHFDNDRAKTIMHMNQFYQEKKRRIHFYYDTEHSVSYFEKFILPQQLDTHLKIKKETQNVIKI